MRGITMADQRVQARFLADHARLMNTGFPEAETRAFWAAVADLPTDDQQEILAEFAEELKPEFKVFIAMADKRVQAKMADDTTGDDKADDQNNLPTDDPQEVRVEVLAGIESITVEKDKLSCDEMEELIVALVIGPHHAEDSDTMRPGMRAAIESHLDGCRVCRRRRESLATALGINFGMTTEKAWKVLKATAAAEQLENALLAEHACLMNAGFPEPETGQFLAKVDQLPDEDKAKLRKLSHVSEVLKRVLTSRDQTALWSPL